MNNFVKPKVAKYMDKILEVGNLIAGEYSRPAYLAGSALTREGVAKHRSSVDPERMNDIDFRVFLSDDEFEARIGSIRLAYAPKSAVTAEHVVLANENARVAAMIENILWPELYFKVDFKVRAFSASQGIKYNPFNLDHGKFNKGIPAFPRLRIDARSDLVELKMYHLCGDECVYLSGCPGLP